LFWREEWMLLKAIITATLYIVDFHLKQITRELSEFDSWWLCIGPNIRDYLVYVVIKLNTDNTAK